MISEIARDLFEFMHLFWKTELAIAVGTKPLPIRTLATISGVLKAGAPRAGRKPKVNAVSCACLSIFDSHKPLAIYGVMLASGVSQLGLNAYG